MRAFIVLFLLSLAACAAKAPDPPSEPKPAYVILPANFVIDLAAGATVRLNPAVREFILYPSAEDARAPLAELNDAFPDGWKIYILEEDFETAAQPRESGYRLNSPARVADWVE